VWPPQRGVGLQEPNLGKTNPRVTLLICLRFVLRPLLRTHLLLLTLTPACSCDYFCKFQFRPIHPPSRRLSAAQPWFIVITSVLCTCPPILSNISAPNILRLIFTLFASAWPSVKFVFFRFQHPHSTLISSPKGYLLRPSWNFGPV
jgi:hypothetical protein